MVAMPRAKCSVESVPKCILCWLKRVFHLCEEIHLEILKSFTVTKLKVQNYKYTHTTDWSRLWFRLCAKAFLGNVS